MFPLDDGYCVHVHSHALAAVVVLEVEHHARVYFAAGNDGTFGDDAPRIILDKLVSSPERGNFVMGAWKEMARAEGLIDPETMSRSTPKDRLLDIC